MANVVEITLRGIDEATRVFENVGKTAERSMSDVNSSVSSVDDSINSVSDLDIDTSGAESAMSNTSNSISGVQDTLQETEQVGKSFGDRMKETFDGIADKWKEITAVAGTAGAASEGFARSQGETNATLERTAIATGESTESLRESADAMSNHTFATSDAIAGMEMLVQRGIDTQGQFEEILPHVDNLADATGKDFPDALESADRLLKPFGQDLNDLGENTDQMTRIMQQTDIPLATLERNLGRVPDELKAMEFGLDDAAAGIEVFRDRGFSGQEAVREFRRAVEESEGDMDAFLETVGLTNEEWEEYQKQVEPAVGLTDELAAANNDQMTVMERLQQNVENLMTKYGGFAEAAGLLAPILMSLGPIMKGVQMATALFNATLWASPITWIIAGIVALIATITLLWMNWDEVSQFLATSWEWIKSVAETVWNGLVAFFQATWEVIKTIFTTTVESIKIALSTAWNVIKTVITTVWNGIKAFFGLVWQGIVAVITTYINMVQTIITTIFNVIKTVITTIWNGIKTFFGLVWQGIVTVVTTYINTVKTVISTVFNVIKTVITTIWNTIKTVTSTVWNTIVSVVTGLINGFKSTISSIFNAIKSVITTIWNTVKSISTSVWNTIVSVVTGVINRLRSGISNVFNTIKSIITTVWNTVKSVSSSVWNGIRSTISGIINGLRSTISSVFNSIKSTITGVWNGIKSTTSSVWNSMVGIVKAPINSIIGLINGMINALNGISIKLPKVPDWVPGIGGKGGSTIGFNIPNVPALATGGVVSEPTLAVVGDAGRGNPEIVAPQKMLSSIMAQELSKVFGNMKPVPSTGDSGDDRPQEIVINLDGREIARATAPHMDRELGTRQHNKKRAEGG